MGKGLGFIAFVIALLMTLFVAHRIGGVQWQLALVLLVGGALVAGFRGVRAARWLHDQSGPS
mgnify:CR=1 FL=1